MVRLEDRYNNEAIPRLVEETDERNRWALPRLKKIVINLGLGEAIQNIKALDAALDQIAAITGQRPCVTRSKKSISNFKLRKGMPIGCMVTLRRDRMYEFLDRLINIALPRVRDFRGLSPHSFDGHGNYTVGLKEQIIFPEIKYDKVDRIRGMNVTIVTTANDDDKARHLLGLLGMPFRKG